MRTLANSRRDFRFKHARGWKRKRERDARTRVNLETNRKELGNAVDFYLICCLTISMSTASDKVKMVAITTYSRQAPVFLTSVSTFQASCSSSFSSFVARCNCAKELRNSVHSTEQDIRLWRGRERASRVDDGIEAALFLQLCSRIEGREVPIFRHDLNWSRYSFVKRLLFSSFIYANSNYIDRKKIDRTKESFDFDFIKFDIERQLCY